MNKKPDLLTQLKAVLFQYHAWRSVRWPSTPVSNPNMVFQDYSATTIGKFNAKLALTIAIATLVAYPIVLGSYGYGILVSCIFAVSACLVSAIVAMACQFGEVRTKASLLEILIYLTGTASGVASLLLHLYAASCGNSTMIHLANYLALVSLPLIFGGLVRFASIELQSWWLECRWKSIYQRLTHDEKQLVLEGRSL